MEKKDNKGLLSALFVALAYTMWGTLTVFWNLLSDVNPVYILAHRIMWSAVFMLIILFCIGKAGEIKEVFKNGKSVLLCVICSVLVTINWGVYIYAVNSSHVLDASLGYFTEPVLWDLSASFSLRKSRAGLKHLHIFLPLSVLYIS